VLAGDIRTMSLALNGEHASDRWNCRL